MIYKCTPGKKDLFLRAQIKSGFGIFGPVLRRDRGSEQEFIIYEKSAYRDFDSDITGEAKELPGVVPPVSVSVGLGCPK